MEESIKSTGNDKENGARANKSAHHQKSLKYTELKIF